MSKIKENSTNFENKKNLAEECLEVYAANIIGGQWSLVICSWLLGGKLRFGELRKLIPNVTERMLTLQLRKLEGQKVIKRTVFAEVPPRVEYELTPIGYELKAIIQLMEEWGKNHKKYVEES